MSRAVMMSIQPQWVEKILNGEKTIEVRKNAPKLETPFKVYIYCTKNKKHELGWFRFTDGWHIKKYDDNTSWACGCTSNIGDTLNGKVVAEFICDRIETDSPVLVEPFSDDYDCETYYSLLDLKREETCLTEVEIWNYGKGERLYLWHISDLKIYDKPKDITEFYSGKQCKDWDKKMDDCVGHGLDYQEKCKHCCGGYIPLTRPPQSWGYVEEIK